MSLNLPSSALEVENRAKVDVQRALPDSDPFLKNSVLGALITGYSNRIFDNYVQIASLRDVLMPDTTDGEFALRWASIWGLTQNPATQSSGFIITGGTVATNVPASTIFTAQGNNYETQASVAVSTKDLGLVLVTRVGSTVTAITDSEHEIGSTTPVTVYGIAQAEYNGTFDVTVVDSTTFTYEISGTPSTPATGSPSYMVTSAKIPVVSQEFQDSEEGVEVNLSANEQLTLQGTIPGLDTEASVWADGVTGGTDQETIAEISERFRDRIQNPVAHFNVSDIVSKAKEVSGVTRVFVQEVTPALGQVTIYFMRDNDPDPIPDAGEVTTTKNKILEIKPANTSDDNVIVNAPTGVPVDFTFTSITPDTAAIRAEVYANLLQFFAEETEIGVNVDQDAYRAVIINTVDPETGNKVSTFSLSSPLGDITVASGEIAVVNSVTFP